MNIRKCLFITANADRNYGGGIVGSRNYDCLKKINNLEIIPIFLNKSKEQYDGNEYYIKTSMTKIGTFINSMFLNIGLLNWRSSNIIIEIVSKVNPEVVFFDGSYYGKLTKKIKKLNQKIKIITYYHNVEKVFSKDLVKINGILYYPIYFASIYNEKLSSLYSDIIIAITKKDNLNLHKFYNKNADYIIPVTIKDKFDIEKYKDKKEKKIKLVFIGSNFFANYQGVKWFVDNVMTEIKNIAILYIVGKGFENNKELISDNVKVIGTCENIEEYYYDSDIFIAPIFYGSGMKVKIAEALMYGKTILGSSEAFEGYEIESVENIGAICNTKEDYIINIKKIFEKKKFSRFNKYSRDIFLQKYSDELAYNMFCKVFNELYTLG